MTESVKIGTIFFQYKNLIIPKYDWISINLVSFIQSITGLVLIMTGFVPYMTEFILYITDFVLDGTGFDLYKTEFVVNKTAFVLNIIVYVLNLSVIGLNIIKEMMMIIFTPIMFFNNGVELKCDNAENIISKF